MYEEILQKIEKECEIRNLSPRTCFIYKFHTTKFLEWAGEKPVSELSLYDVRDYILERRDDGATPGYCNCMCSALSLGTSASMVIFSNNPVTYKVITPIMIRAINDVNNAS